MFNSYWNTSAYFGYTPFSPLPTPSQSYPYPISTVGGSSFGMGGSCYNPHVRTNYQYVCQPTTPEIKTSIEDLRNYVIALEASRKLEDLNDVEFDRPVQPGDVMYFETSTRQWELTNYLTGGTW